MTISPRKPSDDLENWMRNLKDDVKKLPIINIAIPGSHDSCSYGINRHSKPAPDAEKSMVKAYRVLPCVVRRWARTQKYNISEQLLSGIRYFDLRTSKKSQEDQYYFVHGLFCEEVEAPLEELRQFLDTHPEELVILDFQHFYAFTYQDHLNFAHILIKAFGDRIFEKAGNSLLKCTLLDTVRRRKQILIVYREVENLNACFWTARDWPTPWPNTLDVQKLESYLSTTLNQRPPTVGFTSQVVLTPDANFIIPRFFFSLRSRLAKPLYKKIQKWIQEQEPGP